MLSTTFLTCAFRHQIQAWNEICLAVSACWNHEEITLEFQVHSNRQLSVNTETDTSFTQNNNAANSDSEWQTEISIILVEKANSCVNFS